jgi:hypothetical protein
LLGRKVTFIGFIPDDDSFSLIGIVIVDVSEKIDNELDKDGDPDNTSHERSEIAGRSTIPKASAMVNVSITLNSVDLLYLPERMARKVTISISNIGLEDDQSNVPVNPPIAN